MVSPPHFDHEKLDVDQLELKFLSWGYSIFGWAIEPIAGADAGRGRQRHEFFDDARGSAVEWAACLDASVAKGFASLDRIQAGKEMLVPIVAMLRACLEGSCLQLPRFFANANQMIFYRAPGVAGNAPPAAWGPPSSVPGQLRRIGVADSWVGAKRNPRGRTIDLKER
jgi:hypothetical protein